MKKLLIASAFAVLVFAQAPASFAEVTVMNCSGNITVNTINPANSDATISAQITFDANTFNCTGRQFTKTTAPVNRSANLSLAPGLAREILKAGGKYHVNYINEHGATNGAPEDFKEKWIVEREEGSANS